MLAASKRRRLSMLPFMRTLALIVSLLPVMGHAQARVPDSAAEIQLSFAPVVARTAPAVVSVYATFAAPRGALFDNDPLFSEFFRGFGASPKGQNALGSGVLVGDGLMITNLHVVRDAVAIRVVLADRREFSATEVLVDVQADLAVLRLDGAGALDLPMLKIGDSDALAVGDLVLALGNPFGVGLSVSSGIISGLARARRDGEARENGRFFLQTDAPINPGNSGGALVNMAGELVGINTLIVTRSGGSIGLGFATPANLVRQVVAQARAGNARFERPWLGLDLQEVDTGLAEALGLDWPHGLLVRQLAANSPFADAAVVAGDVLVALDGQAINTRAGLEFRMASAPIGSEVAVSWLREGATHTAPVSLVPAPKGVAPQEDGPVTITAPGPFQNRTLALITPDIARYFRLAPAARGVIVVAGPEQVRRSALRVGDMIVAVDGVAITSPGQIAKIAQDHSGWWRIRLVRGTRSITLRTNQ